MAKRWKFAFFALLTVFVAFIITLFILYRHYLPPAEKNDFAVDTKLNADDPMFTVSTTKQQLESLANQQLKEYNDKGSLKYVLDLQKKDVVLKGAITLIGYQVPYEMKFTPKVVEGGNLMLNQHSIRLGLFNLPVDRVLEYVKQSADLPDWVKILPDKKKVYIALEDIRIEDRFYLQARQFDLKNNHIQFSVYMLPNKKNAKHFSLK
jgi:uncharacterized protein YpmS